MQRIRLILNKLVTIKFYFQVNSILQTNSNSICSLFKVKLLMFGPKRFVSVESFISKLKFLLSKVRPAYISVFAWASKFGSINAGSSINGGSIKAGLTVYITSMSVLFWIFM